MSLLNTIGVRVAKLAGWGWTWVHPACRVMRRVIRLQAQGREAEGLARLEGHLGLTPEDYANSGLAGTLAPFHDGPWNLVLLSMLLSTLSSERRGDALALLAADAGIRSSDLREPRLVQSKLARRLEGAHEGAALLYLLAVVNLMEAAEGAEMLERDLGIDPGTPWDCDHFALVVRKRLAELPETLRSGWSMVLLTKLSESERKEDLGVVLQLILESSEAEGADDRAHLERLLALRGKLPLQAATAWTQQVASVLLETGRPALAAALLEAHLGLRPWDDEEDPFQSFASAIPWVEMGNPEPWFFLLVTMLAALFAAGRTRKALAILAVFSGQPLEPARIRATISGIRSRMDQAHAENLAGFLLCVSVYLIQAGRAEIAAELVEGFFDIELSRSSPSELLRRLTLGEGGALSAPQSSLFLLFIGGWGSLPDQQIDQMQTQIRGLAGAYVEHALPSGATAPRDPIVSSAGLLYHFWLIETSRDDPARALEACRAIVSSLRRELAFQDIDVERRKIFVRYATFLLSQILEIGHSGASQETDPSRANALWIDLLVWDAELTERLLLERFLLEDLQMGDPAEEEPVTGWPFAEQRSALASILPEADGLLSSSAVLGVRESSEYFQSGDASSRHFLPELFETAGTALRRGTDETALARVIGRRGLFVRVFPGESGELRWYSFRSDGERLSAGPHGAGDTLGRDRVRWAALRHDVRTTLARFEAVAKGIKRGLVRRELLPALTVIREAARGYLGAGEKQQEIFEGIFRTVLRGLAGQGHPASVELLERLRPLMVRDQRDLIVERLSLLLKDLETPSRMGLRRRLEDIVRNFLDEVESLWPLDELAGVCTEETDVVFHVTDALHAVPLAHLRIAGEPLFRRIRSVRTSFSLILSHLQLETVAGQEQVGAQDGGLLCVSYLDRGDPGWPCVARLHDGQLHLAAEHGLACHAAAETPAGSAGVIRAALRDGRTFHAITLCGHGTRDRPGVVLADGLWQGGGTDLSRVDWLLMVSCSLGRVVQSGDRDAEGFCIRLALHRARSVLACRWPVSAMEAVAFANEALRHYLDLQKRACNEPGFDGESLRARAVNLARKALLDGEEDAGRIGLDTAAAFELYGLG